VRDEIVWSDPSQLLNVAKKAQPGKQSPQILILLAWRLNLHRHGKEAAAAAAPGPVAPPQEFLAHFNLGNLAKDRMSMEAGGRMSSASGVPSGSPTRSGPAHGAAWPKE